MRARLAITLADQEKILKSSNDEDKIEEATKVKGIIDRLHPLIFKNVPSTPGEPELSVLFHDDLSMTNILVENERLAFFAHHWLQTRPNENELDLIASHGKHLLSLLIILDISFLLEWPF